MTQAETALIVDDDENMRSLMEMAIKEKGYTIHAVKNTVVARAWLKSHVPDLIILDLMMPDGNGLDLCRWIRAEQRLSQVPVIVVSGLSDEETIQDALELGAVDFLHKPMTMTALWEKVERLKKRQRP